LLAESRDDSATMQAFGCTAAAAQSIYLEPWFGSGIAGLDLP
jgi:hypothetical protein